VVACLLQGRVPEISFGCFQLRRRPKCRAAVLRHQCRLRSLRQLKPSQWTLSILIILLRQLHRWFLAEMTAPVPWEASFFLERFYHACWLSCICVRWTCKNRPWNDLLCGTWGVKFCSHILCFWLQKEPVLLLLGAQFWFFVLHERSRGLFFANFGCQHVTFSTFMLISIFLNCSILFWRL